MQYCPHCRANVRCLNPEAIPPEVREESSLHTGDFQNSLKDLAAQIPLSTIGDGCLIPLCSFKNPTTISSVYFLSDSQHAFSNEGVKWTHFYLECTVKSFHPDYQTAIIQLVMTLGDYHLKLDMN